MNRRNPVAKAVRTPICRPRRVESLKKYKRKPKHKGAQHGR